MITIEKLMILKDVVPLFIYTSDEILLELAYAVKEQYVMAGELVVKEGELGTTMYTIVQGKMKIHKGDKFLGELREGEIFGVLAALSAEIRTTSVTAIENSLLFVIDQEILYDMMARHIGLVRGIIEELCQRARGTQLTSKSEKFNEGG